LQNGSKSNASNKTSQRLGELSFTAALFPFLITVSTPDKLETQFSETSSACARNLFVLEQTNSLGPQQHRFPLTVVLQTLLFKGKQ